jgi:ElaB/YqjD/DUF883 family membrane-anchored ribosome-binding protein
MEPRRGQVVDGNDNGKRAQAMADDTINDNGPAVPRGAEPGTTKSSTEKAKEKLADAAHTVSEEASKATSSARKTVQDSAAKLSRQATDRARDYATQGKAKASGALAEFSRLMGDAAGSVDEKLGEDYGGYARSAAQSLAGFADSLEQKDIDELLEDLRGFVKRSPAIAVGTAAAIGFVLARLVKSGTDADRDAS